MKNPFIPLKEKGKNFVDVPKNNYQVENYHTAHVGQFRELVVGGVSGNEIITRVLGITIDGGGSAITTGEKGHIVIPKNMRPISWTIVADQSGSIEISIWKDTYANFPPTVADLVNSTAIELASQRINTGTSTGWTSEFNEGDVLTFNVDTASTVTRVNLFVECELI